MQKTISEGKYKGQAIFYTRSGLYRWSNLDQIWKPCKKNVSKNIVTMEFTNEDVN